MDSSAFAGKGCFQILTVRNRNNPRGLLRRRSLSDKQAGFRRNPAQKILKIMCALGVEDVFKAIWSHKLVSNSISSIHEYFIGDV